MGMPRTKAVQCGKLEDNIGHMGTVMAVCISEKRGTQKRNVEKGNLIVDFGLEGDAHAGNWHRQISLLSYDEIEAFRKKGADVDLGDFGENLVVSGFDFKTLPIGTKLQCKQAILEITQIGKECHHHCQIYEIMGDCIMPREGVFAKVLQSGTIQIGDEMYIVSSSDCDSK